MPSVTPITPPRVQMVDPRTGMISREWYLFFLSLFQTSGESGLSLDDLQKGPPPSATSDKLAELTKVVDTLSSFSPDDLQKGPTPASVDQLAELTKFVDALRISGNFQTPPETGNYLENDIVRASDLSIGSFLGGSALYLLFGWVCVYPVAPYVWRPCYLPVGDEIIGYFDLFKDHILQTYGLLLDSTILGEP